jgi:hypothetical protein
MQIKVIRITELANEPPSGFIPLGKIYLLMDAVAAAGIQPERVKYYEVPSIR